MGPSGFSIVPADNGLRRTEDAIVDGLFARLGDPQLPDAQRAAARQAIITSQMRLAWQVAGRYRDRGEPLDDLAQVAMIGLIRAVDGFDLRRGVRFASYAFPTMEGEVKRHFRDKGWGIGVPRRLQELRMDVSGATMSLTQELGRTPTTTDLARYLNVKEADIRECHLSGGAYRPVSLTAPVSLNGTVAIQDHLGGPDEALEAVDDHQALRPLIRQLPARQRRIIGLRFYGDMTQSQIARQLGISQMHVSRLLTRTLDELRTGLLPPSLSSKPVAAGDAVPVGLTGMRFHRLDPADFEASNDTT